VLGTRTSPSAKRASARSDFSNEMSPQLNSRCALSADEDVRVPSKKRLISKTDDFWGKAVRLGLRRDAQLPEQETNGVGLVIDLFAYRQPFGVSGLGIVMQDDRTI